jgi:hypothetical protein
MAFCNDCGTENPDDVKFCSNCGAAIGVVEQEVEPEPASKLTGTLEGKEVKKLTLGGIFAWIFGVFFVLLGLAWVIASDFIAGISLLVISAVLLPPVNRIFREKMNFELSTGLKIVIIIICFIVFSMAVETDTPPSTTDTTPAAAHTPEAPTPTLVTKNASGIVLSIDDMKTGWVVGSKQQVDNTCSASFIRDDVDFVDNKVFVYPTIEDAKNKYLYLASGSSEYKCVSISIGDESYAWEYGNRAEAVFRESNVVVKVHLQSDIWSPTIEQAKRYARIVEAKI